MRTPVKCKNCGLKWLRVIAWGPSLEMTGDLQYNCPKCGSNWYKEIETRPRNHEKLSEVKQRDKKIKLSDIIKIWEILHRKDTGELGYCDLEQAIEQVDEIENDIPG